MYCKQLTVVKTPKLNFDDEYLIEYHAMVFVSKVIFYSNYVHTSGTIRPDQFFRIIFELIFQILCREISNLAFHINR
jgi:hypothetical protein